GALCTCRRVETYGGGGGQVQAFGVSGDGDAYDGVGERAGLLGQPPGLVAEDPGGRAAQGALVQPVVEVPVPGPVRWWQPYTRVPQSRHGLFDGDAYGDGKVEQRADGGAYGLGVVQIHGGVGEDDGLGSGGVGAAQHGAGVPGVAYVREDGDEAGPGGEDLLERCVQEPAHPDESLRGDGGGDVGDDLLGGQVHAGTGVPGRADDVGVPLGGPGCGEQLHERGGVPAPVP